MASSLRSILGKVSRSVSTRRVVARPVVLDRPVPDTRIAVASIADDVAEAILAAADAQVPSERRVRAASPVVVPLRS